MMTDHRFCLKLAWLLVWSALFCGCPSHQPRVTQKAVDNPTLTWLHPAIHNGQAWMFSLGNGGVAAFEAGIANWFSKDGNIVHTVSLDPETYISPVQFQGLIVAFDEKAGTAIAFDQSGKECWHDSMGSATAMRGAIKSDSLMVGAQHWVDGSDIHLLDRKGKVIKSVNIPFPSYAEVETDPTGCSYYVEFNPKFDKKSQLIALSSNGVKLWQTEFNGDTISEPYLVADGTLIVYSWDDNTLYGISSQTGEKVWHFPSPIYPDSAGTKVPWFDLHTRTDGVTLAYAANHIEAISADGKRLWNSELPDEVLFWYQGKENDAWLTCGPQAEIRSVSYLVHVGRDGKLTRRELPTGQVYVTCGPGPDGEFYGWKVDLHEQGAMDWYICRFDLPAEVAK